MVKNLSQLKQAMKTCPRFEIVGHTRPECVGQIRRVTASNSVSFYSAVDGQPEHKISRGNGGMGSILWWDRASSWEFQDGLCSYYAKDREHTPENLVIAFRLLEDTAAAA